MSYQMQSQGPESQQDQGHTQQPNPQIKQTNESSAYQTREGRLGPPPARWGGKPLKPIQAKQKRKPVQKKGNDPKKEKKPMQAKVGTSTVASNGSGSGGGLPTQLKENMESMSGMDLSDVKVNYNSSKPKEMGALAYAQGSQIEIGPGQEKHLPHEAWHTVQQKQGRVQPNAQVQAKGLPLNNDAGLEKEADVMGEKAMNGNFTPVSQSLALQMKGASSTVQTKSVIQMVSTWGGDWSTDKYALTSNGIRRGVDMSLRFKPNKQVDAEVIGLTQTVQAIHNKSPFYINSDPFYEGRAIDKGDAINNSRTGLTDEGTQIDQAKHNRNPLYAVEGAPSTDKKLNDTLPVSGDITKGNSWGKHGFRYKPDKNWKSQDATLIDTPTIGSVDVSKDSAQIFETTAVAVKGNQKDAYYGSVQWGWQTDDKGNHTKIPFKVVSQGVPSSTFIKAAEVWNGEKSSLGDDNLHLPVVDVKLISENNVPLYFDPLKAQKELDLSKDTRVKILTQNSKVDVIEIEVVDGPNTSKVGYIDKNKITDERS